MKPTLPSQLRDLRALRGDKFLTMEGTKHMKENSLFWISCFGFRIC
jgi:hypothetical protein